MLMLKINKNKYFFNIFFYLRETFEIYIYIYILSGKWN